ncbi:MAG TPA: alanine racemase [Rhizomicrobium sp.]|nr:alanine racemase [Rhizomicrobium sp.]
MREMDFETASLTVRLGRITGNYRILRQLAGPSTVAAVVKADGYGLGAGMVAPALQAAGCDTFFVARLQEGMALRPLMPNARIFVLDGAPPDAAPALISHNLTPVLNSLGEIAGWAAAAKAARRALDAAIHIDTGMNRLGLPAGELAILAGEWKTRLAGLNLVLLMSHLACSDEADNKMNPAQLVRFRASLAMLPPAPASLAASGGVLLGRDYLFDLARVGLALYGGNPRPAKTPPVRAVAFLSARVLQTRRIDKGESVGYAATFRAKRPTMLATVALGYADGIMRAAANRGWAAIEGVRVPYVGRVSMDLLTLDVTDMAQAPQAGDAAELLGDTISLAEAAENSGTNEYEILTGLSPRIPRRYTDDAG